MRRYLSFLALILVLALPVACSKSSDQSAGKGAGAGEAGPYKVGQVKMNPHPASLEGKTVVLRWNGKFNGDKLLDRIAEQLASKAPGVKIVKLWTVDPATANSSEGGEKSEKFAESALSHKPDLVIAASAD
ncbi:MAG TPA: hypothetical protein PLA18_10240 [Deltaproteobacteria bacterium]|nr:hypothetical protein [Deltaproteobacteria bacterium]